MDPKSKPASHAAFAPADINAPDRPLALHPSAVGVTYPVRPAEDIATVVDGVAVMCIEGPLSHKGSLYDWCYWDNYERIVSRFCAVLDDRSVNAVILKMNSPGGDVAGLFETVRIMTEAKQKSGKAVVAYVDEDCYSAAYALAMVADEIIIPSTGNVGSVGVITVMAEMTGADKKDGFRFEVISSGAQKADGHPHVELTKEAIGRTQSKVNALAVMFFDLVAGVRGMSASTLEKLQAGTFMGTDAVDAGLADAVMSLSETLTQCVNEFTPTQAGMTQRVGFKGANMAGRIAAKKALDTAKATLAAAKTPDERKTAQAAVTSAELKYKHVKKTVETVESEDEADMPSSEDEGDGEGDGGEGDEEDDEDAKKAAAAASAAAAKSARIAAKKTAAATAALMNDPEVAALTLQLTGKSSRDEVVGALHAIIRKTGHDVTLAAKVAELEGERDERNMTTLINEGRAAGKLDAKLATWAATQPYATVAAYLEHAPPLVKTEATGAKAATVGDESELSDREKKMCADKGIKPEAYVKQRAAIRARSNSTGKVT